MGQAALEKKIFENGERAVANGRTPARWVYYKITLSGELKLYLLTDYQIFAGPIMTNVGQDTDKKIFYLPSYSQKFYEKIIKRKILHISINKCKLPRKLFPDSLDTDRYRYIH